MAPTTGRKRDNPLAHNHRAMSRYGEPMLIGGTWPNWLKLERWTFPWIGQELLDWCKPGNQSVEMKAHKRDKRYERGFARSALELIPFLRASPPDLSLPSITHLNHLKSRVNEGKE
ncbi:unnamed protein product, partial [Mesorhabditis belari]|uniref:Uncharacterized protein n=1 Tax=Mesorhabditis belari TaxID=2138241 RepID=A0AAF3FMQ2_9BILA